MSLSTSEIAADTVEQPLEYLGGCLLEVAEELIYTDPAQAFELATAALENVDAHRTARAYLLIGVALYHQGQLADALPTLTKAQEALSDLGDEPKVLEATLALGRVQRDLGNFESATRSLSQALGLAKRLADPQAETDALNLQATTLCASGEYGPALEVFEQALKIADTCELYERRADILSNVATLYSSLGNYPQALENLNEAYELVHEFGADARSEATNLISLGYVYQEMGAATGAQTLFARAQKLGRIAGAPLVEAVALNNLATVAMHEGNWTDARACFEEALEIARQAGAKQYEIDNLDGLGQLYAALGDFAHATSTHTGALRVARELNDREAEVDALLNLGGDHLAAGQLTLALGFLHEGLALAEALARQPSIVEGHELLARAHEQAGDLTRALHHHRAFHNAEKLIFNEQSEEKTRRLTAQFELERARQQTEEYLLRTRELEEAQLEIVTRLAVAGEYRDDDTGEHTKRVGRNAAAIAHALGWPTAEAQLLFAAAKLHDVGKIGVSDTVLHKTGRLKAEEMALMQTHTTIGARILSAGHSRLLKLAEEIALAHHERWDGKGYPYGLAGEAIPLSARIVTVADVLDALTHERPHKRAWSVDEALNEIQRQSGHHFDPQVVEACMNIFGSGSRVSLAENISDWQAPVRERRKVSRSTSRHYGSSTSLNARTKDQYEVLLAEKALELEAAKRTAQASSDRLQELAFTDPLTRLGNRRAFEEDLEAEAARALRHGDPLSVLTLDLDMLKMVNDNEGHERGDELLRTFGSAFDDYLRDLGKVYRVGGDEFMAILTHVSSGDLAKVLSRVQSATDAVSGSGFPTASVSAGLAVLDEVKAPSDLVRLSDQRMYSDKLRKRNARNSGRYEASRAQPSDL